MKALSVQACLVTKGDVEAVCSKPTMSAKSHSWRLQHLLACTPGRLRQGDGGDQPAAPAELDMAWRVVAGPCGFSTHPPQRRPDRQWAGVYFCQ